MYDELQAALFKGLNVRWCGRTERKMLSHIKDKTSGSCYNHTRVDYDPKTDTSTVKLYSMDIVSVDHSAKTLNESLAILSDYPTNLTLMRINLVLRLAGAYMYSAPHGLIVNIKGEDNKSVCSKLILNGTLAQMLDEEYLSMRSIDGVALSNRFSPSQIDKQTKNVKKHVYTENAAGGGMAVMFVRRVWTGEKHKTTARTTDVNTSGYARASKLFREV